MRALGPGSVGASSLALILGCGASGTDAFCEGVRAWSERCFGPDRAEACDPVLRADLSRFDETFVEEIADCQRNLSCSPTDREWFACTDPVAERIEPRAATFAFCEAIAPRLFACGYLADVPECARSFRLWSDAYLDQLERCVDRPDCDAFATCLEGEG